MGWSSEYGFRLVETLRTIPTVETRSYYDPQTLALSKWTLVDGYLQDDVDIDVHVDVKVM